MGRALVSGSPPGTSHRPALSDSPHSPPHPVPRNLLYLSPPTVFTGGPLPKPPPFQYPHSTLPPTHILLRYRQMGVSPGPPSTPTPPTVIGGFRARRNILMETKEGG